MQIFDVIVIGGGHAGVEAACAAARRGARVALLTFDPTMIGAMSCNPAIGGLGKGHIVREVDALDGVLARAADAAAIHRRMLNASKGAAVRGPRVQADRALFRHAIQQLVTHQPRIQTVIGEAAKILTTGGLVSGVRLAEGQDLLARAVILATGTFLGGRLFRGDERLEGGRINERPAAALAQSLRAISLPMSRLKTGTPPRLDGRTIDWAKLESQPSDAVPWSMSRLTRVESVLVVPQLACAITRTNMATHAIIRRNLHRSPLFAGAIEGQGPRYCPSVEDKIHRFGDRDGHPVFLEPEGLTAPLVYPNGISTSLPVDVQEEMVRSMAGLERAVVAVPGYAVEYDHVDPRALNHQLMCRTLPGLFMAGQINGTTGYEEAAGQGLVAGANAAAFALDLEPLLLDRAESYIGVMIDDLVLQGVTEPYRMLTARAEYRLALRADNASTRLTPLGISLGLVGAARIAVFQQDEAQRATIRATLGETQVSGADLLEAGVNIRPSPQRAPLSEWARYPEMSAAAMGRLSDTLADADPDLLDECLQDAFYAPYVARQQAEIRTLRANEAIGLPDHLDYSAVNGLSQEMVERLSLSRPPTLGAAARVRGVTPAALAALLVAARRHAA